MLNTLSARIRSSPRHEVSKVLEVSRAWRSNDYPKYLGCYEILITRTRYLYLTYISYVLQVDSLIRWVSTLPVKLLVCCPPWINYLSGASVATLEYE